jgi:hypothetical protein
VPVGAQFASLKRMKTDIDQKNIVAFATAFVAVACVLTIAVNAWLLWTGH